MINQFDWAKKWALYSPEKIAVKEFESGRTLTYNQINELSNGLASVFKDRFQIGKGDRIVILAENCLEYIVLFATAQKTGCILVPLNHRLAGEEIDFLLQNADPKLVIVEEKFEHKVVSTSQYPLIPHKMTLDGLEQILESGELVYEIPEFNSSVIHENDPVFILYTSGTTGFPKGSIYTHKMLFWNSINTSMSLIVNTESKTVNCMPMFHTGGWNVLTTPFFHHGGYSCIMKSFDVENVIKALVEEQVTIFMGVPTMLKMIADHPEFDNIDFSSLHYIIVGGEPMPVPLIETWHDKGVPIRQGFGMTEVGPNLTSLHQDDATSKIGSIGRPNFYVETRIISDQNQDCKPNEAGELLLKGPMVSPGYWKNEEGTNDAFYEGWFRTGDRVREDEGGYLYVVDRIKNMYISGGENVYPAEIERVLLEHPGVKEAIVIGVPDEKWGESGHAFIIPIEFIHQEEVISYCKNRLAKFKVPKKVSVIDEFPLNDTGKIDRKALLKL